MNGEIFEECLKVLEVPQNVPHDALSYSERKSLKLCREIAMGVKININEYYGIYDEEKWDKIMQLYLMKYNY